MSNERALSYIDIEQTLALLRSESEFAFIDLREEGEFSRAQPYLAVNIPLSELEVSVARLVPNRRAPVVLFDADKGLAPTAYRRLAAKGYEDIVAVKGDLAAWLRAGGELFRDVNVPSKAFGEWVAHYANTPMITAQALQERIGNGDNIVILDARPFSEYQVMTIPGSISAPGAELVLRAAELVRDEETTIVVNCAGRTRSIIGAQSLINSGLFKHVVALRNGTIGWLIAGFQLEYGADRRAPERVGAENLHKARAAAEALAQRAGGRFITGDELRAWRAESDARSLFCFDVRSPEEYRLVRAEGFRHAPGGQLVQATDEYIGIRNARIVLADDDGVRAAIAASWLRQMGWKDVAVLAGGLAADLKPAVAPPEKAPATAASTVTPETLSRWLEQGKTAVIDLSRSSAYAKGHVPGALFCPGIYLPQLLPALSGAENLVLTSADGELARATLPELERLTDKRCFALAGGTRGWCDARLPLEQGFGFTLIPVDDVYKRPYEGVDSPKSAMQGYIDWELQLVEQLKRDGIAKFNLVGH
ncbi:rhodanese-like domain-containing protein [Brenneria corticis]|uniref:Sulfurtransferase n=1 Tax=Brenneria corticis TaxID=2173106 RepID=A0A2U1TU27_9GAMM|nr:rhodanese-like domain-containing protein [Brenneria sp. CFCC 11842]PWC12911.1 sulfurtransferase [Brenneria sp. CFCC 11842]